MVLRFLLVKPNLNCPYYLKYISYNNKQSAPMLMLPTNKKQMSVTKLAKNLIRRLLNLKVKT